MMMLNMVCSQCGGSIDPKAKPAYFDGHRVCLNCEKRLDLERTNRVGHDDVDVPKPDLLTQTLLKAGRLFYISVLVILAVLCLVFVVMVSLAGSAQQAALFRDGAWACVELAGWLTLCYMGFLLALHFLKKLG